MADYNLSLKDLIGVIRGFFEKIGITQLRFKPAFNPYTEPSMEVFGFHPDLNKWTEIGNSGMFRPEMLQPMGLPPGVRVIAWGLSLRSCACGSRAPSEYTSRDDTRVGEDAGDAESAPGEPASRAKILLSLPAIRTRSVRLNESSTVRASDQRALALPLTNLSPIGPLLTE